MNCTLADCGEESTLYLCEEHRLELADLLTGVDFLITNLDPQIQATKVTRRPGTNEGGNSTNKAASRPPTIDTTQLRYWLWELPNNAYKEARNNPQAGHTLAMARIWVPRARTLVYGTEPETPPQAHELKHRLAVEVPEELPVPKLLEWLKVTHGIDLKPSRIWKWAERGQLTRTNTTGRATYSPAAVLVHARREGCRR